MRIASHHMYDASIKNLQSRQEKLASSQEQLSTGRRVNYASDDPTAAARAERALAAIARTEANQRTIDASRNVMNIAESALGNGIELLQSARETLIAAGNGSYSDGERQALAIKLKDIRDQLLAVANRPDGGGGFVFGGQGSSTPPFVETVDGVVFRGQSGETLSSTGERLNLSIDGDLIWLKGKSSANGVFNTGPGTNTLTGMANTGTAWITSGSVTVPSELPYPATPSPNYSINFTVSGGTVTYDILEDGNPIASGQPYESGKEIAIPGKGMAVAISGNPADGDSFAIGESNNDLNIFQSLDSMIASLQTKNQPGGAVQQAVNAGMAKVDAALTSLMSSRSAVGEQLNRMEGIESRNADQKLAAQTEQSNAVDLDEVAAISDFQNQMTGYQAALQSYASIQKLSLFNYINS